MTLAHSGAASIAEVKAFMALRPKGDDPILSQLTEAFQARALAMAFISALPMGPGTILLPEVGSSRIHHRHCPALAQLAMVAPWATKPSVER